MRHGPAIRRWALRVGVVALGAALGAPEARAAEVVVSAREPLRPGVAGVVWVAVSDDGGRPATEAPTVTARTGQVVPLDRPAPPGVFAVRATPSPEGGELILEVARGAERTMHRVPVQGVERSRLDLPRAVVARVGDTRIRLPVRGDDLPPPEALQVVASEGRVVSVRSEPGVLWITLAPDDDPYPRRLVVGVRDARSDDLPTFTRVSLHAGLEVPVRTEEPGASVRIAVGDRRYGPVVAGEDGVATVSIVQHPEERTAEVAVVRPSGFSSTQQLPLSRRWRTELLALPSGPRVPGERAPVVFLHGSRPDGRPWRGPDPVCQDPRTGTLPVVPVGPDGTWILAVPPVAEADTWELRVRCQLGEEVTRTLGVPYAADVPVALSLRVWPEELSADFPVADVAVGLANGLGERIDAEGRFVADARYGQVSLEPTAGATARGEYVGGVTAEVGEDTLSVSWFAPPGAGWVDRLEVVPAEVPEAGFATIRVRALDPRRRPLPGVEVAVGSTGGPRTVTTAADGWAEVRLPVPEDGEVLRWQAATAHRRVTALSLRGTRWDVGGPGAPDLQARRGVVVDPGRVAQVELTVSPRILRPGRRAEAEVSARFLDREGALATSALPELSASEGRLEALEPTEDGQLRWRFRPDPGYRTRRVAITARSELLDVEESTGLQVRLAPLRAALGVGASLHTNFGAILSPRVHLDGDVRVVLRPDVAEEDLGPSRFVVRASLSWYAATVSGDLGLGAPVRSRIDLIPVSLLLMLRQERDAHAFWVGLGAEVAPYVGTSTLDDQLVEPSAGVLPPGLAAVLGYGIRVPGGEISVELRGSTLTSAGTTVPFEGPLGGLSAGLGYRLHFGAGR